jgi:hypothetical protein
MKYYPLFGGYPTPYYRHIYGDYVINRSIEYITLSSFKLPGRPMICALLSEAIFISYRRPMTVSILVSQSNLAPQTS